MAKQDRNRLRRRRSLILVEEGLVLILAAAVWCIVLNLTFGWFEFPNPWITWSAGVLWIVAFGLLQRHIKKQKVMQLRALGLSDQLLPAPKERGDPQKRQRLVILAHAVALAALFIALVLSTVRRADTLVRHAIVAGIIGVEMSLAFVVVQSRARRRFTAMQLAPYLPLPEGQRYEACRLRRGRFDKWLLWLVGAAVLLLGSGVVLSLRMNQKAAGNLFVYLGGVSGFLSLILFRCRWQNRTHAAQLFALYVDGQLSAEDKQVIDEARSKNPEFDRELREFLVIQNLLRVG